MTNQGKPTVANCVQDGSFVLELGKDGLRQMTDGVRRNRGVHLDAAVTLSQVISGAGSLLAHAQRELMRMGLSEADARKAVGNAGSVAYDLAYETLTPAAARHEPVVRVLFNTKPDEDEIVGLRGYNANPIAPAAAPVVLGASNETPEERRKRAADAKRDREEDLKRRTVRLPFRPEPFPTQAG